LTCWRRRLGLAGGRRLLPVKFRVEKGPDYIVQFRIRLFLGDVYNHGNQPLRTVMRYDIMNTIGSFIIRPHTGFAGCKESGAVDEVLAVRTVPSRLGRMKSKVYLRLMLAAVVYLSCVLVHI
jgi:hypothetical protein